MKITKTAALLAVSLIFLLSACGTAKNTATPTGEIKQSSTGVKYVLTCIEGKNFIATQAAYNYWTLAGPVGVCSR